jgi:hypothetical protein
MIGAIDQLHVDMFKSHCRRPLNDRRGIGGAGRERGEEGNGCDDREPGSTQPRPASRHNGVSCQRGHRSGSLRQVLWAVAPDVALAEAGLDYDSRKLV